MSRTLFCNKVGSLENARYEFTVKVTDNPEKAKAMFEVGYP